MYSSKKDKFNTDLLKAQLAKAKELEQAIKVDELTAFDQANIDFVGGGYRNRTGVHGFAIGQHQYISLYNSMLNSI